MTKKIGCGTLTIGEPRQPHKTISLFRLGKPAISKKAAELYAKGYSLRGIASETGVCKTVIRNILLSLKTPLRTHSNNQIKRGIKGRKRSVKNAPYGYCLINGQLREDPREMENVRLMLKWWREGMSIGAIARKLNALRRKPRKALSWSQPTIGFIIQRQKAEVSQN